MFESLGMFIFNLAAIVGFTLIFLLLIISVALRYEPVRRGLRTLIDMYESEQAADTGAADVSADPQPPITEKES